MNRRDFLKTSTLVATISIALPATATAKLWPGTTTMEAATLRPRVLQVLFAQDADDFAENLVSCRVVADGVPEAEGLKWVRYCKVPMQWLEEATAEEMRADPMMEWITRDFDLADAEIKINFATA